MSIRWVALLVEGQTEEAFANTVLAPTAESQGVSLTPMVVKTSATPTGSHKGGGGWQGYDRMLRNLLRQPHWRRVGLMIDYYGYPPGAPGQNGRRSDANDRHQLTEALTSHYVDPAAADRFCPLIIKHEFESLVLAAIDGGAGDEIIPSQALRSLRAAIKLAGTPEDVNNGAATSPSKRLKRAFPRYSKTVDGITLIQQVGLTAILERCPVFSAWWRELLA
ncbi:DUF4276 family protein [Actinomyces ruminicola]|uniref:DUF4276 family protein n=1 Tax=Actinomyces ruminicola TaxID=332524 RepID=A0A1G9S7S5_9ACTO|nr:DUF4276 family protein [Actinomyces ruminicola]SDM31504.1 protein of unknown function [Actinomyces ruminicola]